MKNKFFTFLTPLVAFVFYLTLSSYSGGISEVSTTGCTCHSPSPSSSTVISLSGLPSSGYVNGTTYSLTLSVTNLSIVGPMPRDGFDMSVSDGAFTSTNETQLFSATEIGHNSPKVAVTGNVTWTFIWTAPVSGNNPIIFDVACNATNGDGSNGPNDIWNSLTTTVLSDTSNIAGTILTLKLFYEGYYAGSSTMVPVLMNQGISANSTDVDDILVELKDEITHETFTSILTTLQTNGNAVCNFGAITGNYYIAVSHRNGLQTWSSTPIPFVPGNNSYDFTTAANKAYGSNMKEIETGVWAFYSGDLNHDENLDLLDISEVETDISNFQFGYFSTDLNGDGNVDLLDSPALEIDISNFIFSNHP